ncbi:MAG: DUF423 domain-containing protein [Alphaproteobacteria bacterium]|nr:DUF423 domain-containing protein [Alphaproteobacteria bacterium]
MIPIMRFWLALGALYGFVAVAMGAMGAHYPGIDDAGKEWLRTASLYQAIHALALIGIAALSEKRLTFRLSFAGLAFALGVLMFSGGLYARALLGLDLGALVPAGGMAFLAGWLLLFLSAFGRR